MLFKILNAKQKCFISKVFRSIAHQTWKQCYNGHKIDHCTDKKGDGGIAFQDNKQNLD